MSVKPRKRKSAKPAAARPAARSKAASTKTLKPRPELSSREVASLEKIVARQQQSERAWQRLTAAPDDDDGWGQVEEHLLTRTQARSHSERRWKYFAK